MEQHRCFQYIFLLSIVSVLHAFKPITLRTSTTIKDISGPDLLNFLSVPSNWPRIVLSSNSVKGPKIDEPLQKGAKVSELFGLPPLLPLEIEWNCVSNTYPILDVASPGVTGIASDCQMLFTVDEMNNDAVVNLEMTYTPVSPLAILAVPVLSIDNAIAVKALLPFIVSSDRATMQRQHQQQDATSELTKPLDDFRLLMGNLYFIAGIAHFLDLLFGGSALFTSTGIPAYAQLPITGQVGAIVWCAAGPLAYVCSRGVVRSGRIGADGAVDTNVGPLADAGLALYGVIEVGGAAVAAACFPEAAAALPNAVGVQLIVLISWFYSKYFSKRNIT